MEVSVNNQTAVENPPVVVPVSQCDPEDDITLHPKKKTKKRKTKTKKKMTEEELSAAARECPAIDILSGGGGIQSRKRRRSQ